MSGIRHRDMARARNRFLQYFHDFGRPAEMVVGAADQQSRRRDLADARREIEGQKGGDTALISQRIGAADLRPYRLQHVRVSGL